MTPESLVVEDGVEERGPPEGTRSSWLLVAVAFALGLALGTLASPPEAREVADDATSDPTTLDAPLEPFADESESGISDLVADFPDALVAVGDGIGSGHDYLLWPVGGPLVTRSMTGGDEVLLDATGQFIAMIDRVPGLDGAVLSIGRFNGIRAVSSGVTSHVWHDGKSGDLAFTTETEGEWLLQRVSGNFKPATVVGGPADGRTVAAWGQWGFAVQTPDREVMLLNPGGEMKAIEPGVVLASHHSGWLLVEDGGLKLVSAGGGVSRLDLVDVPERIFAAAFAPDGNRVAVAGRVGVVVYDLDDEDEIANLSGYPGGWLAWSSDSRFIIAPARSGVVIHDLETGNSLQTLVGHNVIVAQVLPLSTS